MLGIAIGVGHARPQVMSYYIGQSVTQYYNIARSLTKVPECGGGMYITQKSPEHLQ